MSKSLRRVCAALAEAGYEIEPVEMASPTHTAAEAAAGLGCDIDQIGKSIIFRGETSGDALLFLTAGGNRVDAARAATLAGEPLGKADAALIRERTGFAIGGVAPVGHVSAVRAFMDPRLLDFDLIWCAAGTPRHNFGMDPTVIARLANAEVADFTVVPPEM